MSRGPAYYDCVAISQTGDPTGAYYRYAFITQPDPLGGTFFPDYPKYSVWTNSYITTTRDFGFVDYGISVYALEKNKMIAGNPKARAVQFFLDSNVVPLNLIGDGLLPADIDGTRRPIDRAPAPIIGTQDDGGGYGATFDALNVWELSVQWQANPVASLTLKTQLPVASFDSIFPCAPTSRDCLPQPGITNPTQYLDTRLWSRTPHPSSSGSRASESTGTRTLTAQCMSSPAAALPGCGCTPRRTTPAWRRCAFLRDELRNRRINYVEFSPTIELLTDDKGHVTGAVLVNMETNELTIVRAKAVVMATGGMGRLHIQGFPTTNHYGASADGLVLAYRGGAKLIFMDSMQYHPTGAAYPMQILGQLVTEKVRTLGAPIGQRRWRPVRHATRAAGRGRRGHHP